MKKPQEEKEEPKTLVDKLFDEFVSHGIYKERESNYPRGTFVGGFEVNVLKSRLKTVIDVHLL